MRRLGVILTVLLVVFVFAGDCLASEAALNDLRDSLLSYFKPVKGGVKAVLVSSNGSTVISDLGSTSGVKKGMRFAIKREGSAFLHPITKEPIGKIEKSVGVAEATEVMPDNSMLSIVEGEAQVGDILRLSSAKVAALYQQTKDADWFLLDEYLRKLDATGRFDLIEAAPASEEKEILERAKSLGVEMAIVLSPDNSNLKQRLIWVDKPEEFSALSVKIDEAYINNLKLGKELFMPKTKK